MLNDKFKIKRAILVDGKEEDRRNAALLSDMEKEVAKYKDKFDLSIKREITGGVEIEGELEVSNPVRELFTIFLSKMGYDAYKMKNYQLVARKKGTNEWHLVNMEQMKAMFSKFV